MFQTEKQEKIPEELSKVGTNNLPETKLKVMIIKMLKELERRIGEYSERINKERIKQLKNRKAEIKNILKGINSG